jgi:hypothetical protein
VEYVVINSWALRTSGGEKCDEQTAPGATWLSELVKLFEEVENWQKPKTFGGKVGKVLVWVCVHDI